MIVSLKMDLEMVASREGAGTVLALVTFVAGVQFYVPVSASFVLEGSITIIAGVDGALVISMMMMVMVVVVAVAVA